MVVVPKKNSDEPRITIGLNKYVVRPNHPTDAPKEAIARVPQGMKFFRTLDAKSGYWQVLLDEESRKLTTFITPFGCYRFKKNIMGLASAGDEHNRRNDNALMGINNMQKVVEDVLVYDSDLKGHWSHVKNILERCRAAGITLNKKKFHFGQNSVEWCGYQIGENGYTVNKNLVQALRNFPIPKNKTDIIHGSH